MNGCLICLREVRAQGPYHRRCVRRLFEAARVPAIEIELVKLHTFALAMVGHTALSGVQRKISLGLGADRMTLQVGVERMRYILKPTTGGFPALPENEHVTMRLAALCGIEIPECGLLYLKDGSLAYIMARFDRPAGGGKLRQEDFCQLATRSPKDKYDGSAELCVRLVRRYATEARVELLKLFRRLLFAWWSGNGDMHLKNFSLLADPEGRHRLSPAYDQVCTRILIPADRLALPVGGKDEGITRRTWLELGDYAGLPRPIVERELASVAAASGPGRALIDRSLLPGELKAGYAELIAERSSLIARP